MVTPKFYQRFSRQEPVIGADGQLKLAKSKVLVVGIGGLGCPASLYLSQSGIGTLTLIDHDIIELSNLHRQILFTEDMITKNKAFSAAAEISRRNSQIKITSINHKVDVSNALSMCMNHDIILDCTDNYESRYLLNSASKELKIPLVSASIFLDEASVFTVNLNNGPCLECIFPDQPPLNITSNCSESGVFGIDAGIVALFQAKEAINVLLNESKLNSKIMSINLHHFSLNIRDIKKNPACQSLRCSTTRKSFSTVTNIDLDEFSSLVNNNPSMHVIDVRSPEEHEESNLGGVNIPIATLSKKLSTLNQNSPIVVYCKTGRRSQVAANYLAANGFTKVIKLNSCI